MGLHRDVTSFCKNQMEQEKEDEMALGCMRGLL